MATSTPPVLRPLGIADLLDTALNLYRQNFSCFIGITAIIYVPLGIVQVVTAYLTMSFLENTPNPTDVSWEKLTVYIISLVGILLLLGLAAPICEAALAVAVSRRYLNQKIGVGAAYRFVGKRFWLLVGLLLLVGLMVGVGTLFCIVPGIYLGVLCLFVSPIIVIEGLPGLGSLRRSLDLVQGEWWRCFSVYLLLNMLIGLLVGAIAWPVSILTIAFCGEANTVLAQAINQAVKAAAIVVVQPLNVTGLVLLYYDLRVRKEGFDLQLLAQTMGSDQGSPTGGYSEKSVEPLVSAVPVESLTPVTPPIPSALPASPEPAPAPDALVEERKAEPNSEDQPFES